MAFTLICHACGQKLTLFDLDVKKRKGTVRCTRCGARISYDLDKRNIQQSGFWAAEEPAFDSRAKNRLVNQLKREEARKAKAEGKDTADVISMEQNPSRVHDFDENPFSAKAGFAKFDLKTGQIIGDKPEKTAAPLPRQEKDGITFKVVDRSHQKRTIRTAHRNMQLVRQAGMARAPKAPVKISKIQSFWQKVKSFFSFGHHK